MFFSDTKRIESKIGEFTDMIELDVGREENDKESANEEDKPLPQFLIQVLVARENRFMKLIVVL